MDNLAIVPIVTTFDKNLERTTIPVSTVLEDHGYSIIQKIGSGSYAKVKTAHSSKEKSIVAIKIVSKLKAPNDYLQKFLPREIDVVKGLDHINLIKYYRCIETTHRVYIIMQYAENGPLLDLIRSEDQLDELRARVIYHQLLNAIEYCHNHGIVHRDIKCENILFDKHFTLKLIDFGFARKYTNTSRPNGSILSDTYCGSYAYACPQILKGIPYNPYYADIWASGVVLFAMVFGRLPFDDGNYFKLIKQVQAKINFSNKGTTLAVSQECKNLITKVIAPYYNRSSILQIREDTWMKYSPPVSIVTENE